MLGVGEDSDKDEMARTGYSEELQGEYTQGSWRRRILRVESHFIYENGGLDIK